MRISIIYNCWPAANNAITLVCQITLSYFEKCALKRLKDQSGLVNETRPGPHETQNDVNLTGFLLHEDHL